MTPAPICVPTPNTVRLLALRAKLTDAQDRLRRLYATIENGIADASDATLKERVSAVKTERDISQVASDRAVSEMRPDVRVTEDNIGAFAELMRTNIMNGEIPFRRAYIRSLIDQVEVDDAEIRIHGRRSVLERLVMRRGGSRRSAQFCSEVARPKRFELHAQWICRLNTSLDQNCHSKIHLLMEQFQREPNFYKVLSSLN